MTTPVSKSADVGGWFRTAKDGVALPSKEDWGPGTGGFGFESPRFELRAALDILKRHRTLVLTGAGMSTGSGLPDYRGRDAVPRSPMLYSEFVDSDLSRRRYWARSTVGWRHFRNATAGAAHRSLAELAQHLDFVGVVTQNVDGLHQEAGLAPVVDLHGNLSNVICLACRTITSRDDLQQQFLTLNPAFRARLVELENEASTAPDGDAEVDRTETFRYPDCQECGGILKPDVVFFGENAHKPTVDDAFKLFDEAEAVLVLGSSLTVMSGLRFVRRAKQHGKPVVIVGDGYTRGDEFATARIHGRLERVLPAWIAMHNAI